MGPVKDRNGMDLKEAEEIKKRWQEYPELCKKSLIDPDNHDGVITHLDQTCSVKSSGPQGSITMNKASGGAGTPGKLVQILKGAAMKVLCLLCQQVWETQQWPQHWKKSVFIPVPEKGSAKVCSNYHIIALISHAIKVMLKILQARLQQYLNQELLDVHAGFRGARDQIAKIVGSQKKLAREFQKNICFIDYA